MKLSVGWVSNVPGQAPDTGAPVGRSPRCKTPEQRTRRLRRLGHLVPVLFAVPALAACDVVPSPSYQPVYSTYGMGTQHGYYQPPPAPPSPSPQRQVYVPEPPAPRPVACNSLFSNCANAGTLHPSPPAGPVETDNCHGWWRVCHAWQ
jgi:hypothetical protein